ncbi:MAG: hypothetical protein V3S89_01045 [Desulfobacterales bacterium]
MSLVARQLEENGICTVILGSAKDIVEYCGVPRLLFLDFPLGNPSGRPYDPTSQREIISDAFDLLATATAARTTVQTLHVWDDASAWKDNFMRVDASNIEELREMGEQRKRAQAAAKGAIQASGS